MKIGGRLGVEGTAMHGPGAYIPDATDGIPRVEDLAEPRIEQRSRNDKARRCPRCGTHAGRYATATRTLHDSVSPLMIRFPHPSGTTRSARNLFRRARSPAAPR